MDDLARPGLWAALRYIVATVDDLGPKLAAEPSTYDGHLTLKRIKSVLGRYGPAEATLSELVVLGSLKKGIGRSGKTIYLPTPEGRTYLARLRFHLEELTKEVRNFSERLRESRIIGQESDRGLFGGLGKNAFTGLRPGFPDRRGAGGTDTGNVLERGK